MKWSEQMRVLQSEDEHYNQLMYNMDSDKLYINGEFIADIEGTVSYSLSQEIKKKYPFFTDENFLLHCVFKFSDEGIKTLEKAKSISIKKVNGKLVTNILSVTTGRSLMIEME